MVASAVGMEMSWVAEGASDRLLFLHLAIRQLLVRKLDNCGQVAGKIVLHLEDHIEDLVVVVVGVQTKDQSDHRTHHNQKHLQDVYAH
jgi:hypothetical protein